MKLLHCSDYLTHKSRQVKHLRMLLPRPPMISKISRLTLFPSKRSAVQVGKRKICDLLEQKRMEQEYKVWKLISSCTFCFVSVSFSVLNEMGDKNFARNKIMFWFRFETWNLYVHNVYTICNRLPTHDFCTTSDIYSIYFAFISLSMLFHELFVVVVAGVLRFIADSNNIFRSLQVILFCIKKFFLWKNEKL